MDNLLYTISKTVERYDFHPAQRMLYSYDMLPIPRFFRRFIKIPEVVVQPQNDNEVVALLQTAKKLKLPVVPRGAATSVYGGSLPLKRCMIVDFTRMNRIEINKDDMTVIAESGAIWWNVERELEKCGLALRVYPTSAPAATVGGWVAQNGFGVGSLKYGAVADNILWIDVAGFDGVKRIDGEKLKFYVGMHGTTGMILRACIRVRERTGIRCESLTVRNVDELYNFIDSAYHSTYFSEKFLKLVLNDKISGNILHVCFEEGEEGVYGDETGILLWENRFTLLKARKKGKILLSEVVIPVDNFQDFIDILNEKDVAYAAQPLRDRVLVFTLFIAEDGYISTMLNALKTIKLAEKFDGVVYSTGMLFPHKSGKLIPHVREVKKYKAEIDPQNLLNPGKVVQSNSISRIVRLIQRMIV
jgi:FAD/FMN-containing dehydrogenase